MVLGSTSLNTSQILEDIASSWAISIGAKGGKASDASSSAASIVTSCVASAMVSDESAVRTTAGSLLVELRFPKTFWESFMDAVEALLRRDEVRTREKFESSAIGNDLDN